MTEPRPPEDPSPWKSLGLFGIIVADLIVYPGVCYWLAQMVEEYFGLGQWARFLGLLVGFALAFLQIYRISKRP